MRVTAINSFIVEPSRQSELVEIATELSTFTSGLQGFIRQEIKRSEDGTRVLIITDWKSADDHYNCMENASQPPAGQRMISLLASGAVQMHLGLYENVSAHWGCPIPQQVQKPAVGA